MADPCLQISIVETAGALSAIGLPVLLLAVSVAFAYGALGETGLLLVFRGLQCVGVFRGSLAVIALPALGRMAAAEAVKFAGADGVTAGALAAAAGATVSAFISVIVAALTARSIRARLDTAVLMISTAAGGLLFQMGMSLLFGQRNRDTGGTHRGMNEDEDEDTEVNSEEEKERDRKKRRRKKKRTTTTTVTYLKNTI